jgi:hypothetical protein
MPFPTSSLIEEFTGEDDASPPNANWTNDPFGFGPLGLKISSNQAAGLTGAGVDSAYYDAEEFGPDCEAYATIPVLLATDTAAIMVLARLATPGAGTLDGYGVAYVRDSVEGDTIRLARIDDSTPAYLGDPVAQAVSAGDAIGIAIAGSTITAYYKPAAGEWTELTTETDATYSAAGYVGLWIGDATARVDDFGAGTLGGESGPTFPGGKMLRGVGGA